MGAVLAQREVHINTGYSEVAKPLNDVVARVPRCWSTGHRYGRLASFQGFLLHFHVDFNVLAGRRDAEMTEPSANNVEFHTSL